MDHSLGIFGQPRVRILVLLPHDDSSKGDEGSCSRRCSAKHNVLDVLRPELQAKSRKHCGEVGCVQIWAVMDRVLHPQLLAQTHEDGVECGSRCAVIHHAPHPRLLTQPHEGEDEGDCLCRWAVIPGIFDSCFA